MTKEEILAMEAGEELDRLVATEVMGEPIPEFTPENTLDLQMAGSPVESPQGNWLCLCRYEEDDIETWRPLPFSTDISAAWQVMKKMIGLGFEVTFNYCHTDKWSISFFDERPEMVEGIGKEAPEAISKAALLAKPEGQRSEGER